ncbi:MAG: PEGA domain-containing protein [Pseudomonadota bacterium]
MAAAPLSLIVLAVALAAEPASQKALSSRTVAVYPLVPLGTDAEVALRLEALVHAELSAIGEVIVVPRAEATALKDQWDIVGKQCPGHADCLAEFGRGIGADRVLYATVAGLGASYVLDAKLVDSVGRTVLARQSVVLQGEQAVLIRGVRELAVQLVAPTQFVGALDLRIDEPGARVFIDGGEVGVSPLPLLRTLSPGKHALRVVQQGRPDFDHFVEVTYGSTTVLELELASGTVRLSSQDQPPRASIRPKVEDPPGSPAWLLPVGVATSVLGAAVLVAGLVASSQLLLPWLASQQYTRTVEGERTVVTDRDAYRAEVERYHAAEGFWWTGVALGTTGVLLIPLGVVAIVMATGAAADGEVPVE